MGERCLGLSRTFSQRSAGVFLSISFRRMGFLMYGEKEENIGRMDDAFKKSCQFRLSKT